MAHNGQTGQSFCQTIYKNQIKKSKVLCLNAYEDNVILLCDYRQLCISLLILHSKIKNFTCGMGEDTKSMELYCVGWNSQNVCGYGRSGTHTLWEGAVMVRSPAVVDGGGIKKKVPRSPGHQPLGSGVLPPANNSEQGVRCGTRENIATSYRMVSM